MNDPAIKADLLELDKAIDDRCGDKTLDMARTGIPRATNLESEPSVDVNELPPPPPGLFGLHAEVQGSKEAKGPRWSSLWEIRPQSNSRFLNV